MHRHYSINVRIENLEPRRLLTATPQVVRDINPNFVVFDHLYTLFKFDDLVAFPANDVVTGMELWVSDGTEAGTIRLKDIATGPAGSNPTNFVEFDGKLYFTADDGTSGQALWKTDGTPGGTEFVIDLAAASGNFTIGNFIAPGDELLFSADDGVNGHELWATNGTAAGTRMVKDIAPGPASASIGRPVVQGDAIYFIGDDGTTGSELWRSDGTAEGTHVVSDLSPAGGPVIINLGVAGNLLFFNGYNAANGVELWASDGTPDGTYLVRDIRGGPQGSNPSQFIDVGGTLFFTANDGTNGVELWKSDGTAAGTSMVRNIRFVGDGQPTGFTNIDGKLWFSAIDNSHGREPWKSDGTLSGTNMVTDVVAGLNVGSGAAFFTPQDGLVYFVASDEQAGHELWVTDGTQAGTQRIFDMWPGPSGSSPRSLTNVNGTIFYIAGDPAHGLELFKLPDEIAPRVLATAYEFETAQRVTIKLTDDVSASLAPGDLQVQLLPGGPTISPDATSFNSASNTAAFTFAALADGNYRATLPAGSVADASGNLLESDASVDFFIFAGDANRDRAIDIADFAILSSRFNLPGTFSQGDFNYDGVTDIGDFAILASKFNQTMPLPRMSMVDGASQSSPLRYLNRDVQAVGVGDDQALIEELR